MAPITLFDLASGDEGKNVCWSLNPWKTRLILNYKGIEYVTKFLEYPDLKSFFTEYGVSVNPSQGKHTIPTIELPDGTFIMDSKPISVELEKQYPEPSLHLDAPELPEVLAALSKAVGPLRNEIIPRIARHVISPGSKEFFYRTRKESFGMSLDDLQEQMGGEKAWENAQENWKEAEALLQRNPEGPFVLGKTVSYADFYVVSALIFARRAGEDIYQRIIGISPAFGVLFDACKPWMERDDH